MGGEGGEGLGGKKRKERKGEKNHASIVLALILIFTTAQNGMIALYKLSFQT